MSIPRNYQQAKEFFDGRRNKSAMYRSIAGYGNTSVALRYGPGGVELYAVELYATDIITYHPDGRVGLHPYDSVTTNARRKDAGAPLVRGVKAMGVPKPDRLGQEVRWDIRSSVFPYGLPAGYLMLSPDGEVELVDGIPVDEVTEAVLVPIEDATKNRRRVLRRTRQLLDPVLNARDQMGDTRGRWEFDVDDCLELVAAVDRGVDTAEAVAQFINDYECAARWDTPATNKASFEKALSALMPANNKDNKALWKRAIVKPSQLKEVLS